MTGLNFEVWTNNLIGRADIAVIFDVGRSTVPAWIDRHRGEGAEHPFPFPVATINGDATEVYDRTEVEAWGRVTGRLDLEKGRLYDERGYDITDEPIGRLLKTVEAIEQSRKTA